MKKKMLIVIQLVRRGGVELVAINFARKINKSKFDISFLLVDPYENQDEELLSALKNEGFSFIEMPKNANGYLKKYKFICDLMKKEHFDIVHSHVILFSGIVLAAAKRNGVRVRIAHSHIVKWNRQENFRYKVYKRLMQYLLCRCANIKIGCCRAAGEFLFGKKQYDKNGIFVANGVNTEKFSFNEVFRNTVRKEFDIKENELLIGHIGSVYKIKNQVFLVEVFAEMLKKQPQAKLLLVGELFDSQPVIEKAKELGVYDKLIFAGQRSDIFRIYSAFDIMIFPSLHEALPVSLIEAQAAKLPCLISDTVTAEVKFNDNIDFMSLNETADRWAERVFELLKMNRESISTDDLTKTYDINLVAEKLEKIYSV